MANVTLTVAEHDQLRNDISTLVKQKQELIDSLPRVIVENKGYDLSFSINTYLGGHEFKLKGLQYYQKGSGPVEIREINATTNLDSLIKCGLISINLSPNSRKNTSTYQNLDETVQHMTETFEVKYAERLSKAEERATNAEIISSQIEDKYRKEIDSLQKEISILKGEKEEESNISLIESLREELAIANQTIESLKNPAKSPRKKFWGIF